MPPQLECVTVGVGPQVRPRRGGGTHRPHHLLCSSRPEDVHAVNRVGTGQHARHQRADRHGRVGGWRREARLQQTCETCPLGQAHHGRQAACRHHVILIEDRRETAGVSVRQLHLEDAPSTASNGLSTNTHCPRSEGASSLFPHPKPHPHNGGSGLRRRATVGRRRIRDRHRIRGRRRVGRGGLRGGGRRLADGRCRRVGGGASSANAAPPMIENARIPAAAAPRTGRK